MLQEKREHPKEKTRLHPRNRHRERYDFKLLIESCHELAQYVKPNIYNDDAIDFFDPAAVKILNKSLLKHYYGIRDWDIPPGYLCPAIPGRADYLHYAADLLGSNNYGKIPTGNKIKCIDIGTGASCVYPIIGSKEYGWSFTGTDIDSASIESANKIIANNPFLKSHLELRLQPNPKDIFKGIIQKNELFHLSICNPPFHNSFAAAQAGTIRKLTNLKRQKVSNPISNFGGRSGELWCEGGEVQFVKDMILESKQFAFSCSWFSTAVSKQSHLSNIYQELKMVDAVEVKTFPMGQGNKSSRIVAWTFLSKELLQHRLNTK